MLHTLSANCHERIFVDGTFKLPWFLTMIEFISNAFLSGTKRAIAGTPLLSGFCWDHLVCAVFMCVTHGCSNVTLLHLNFTTTTLFKSAKVFFVMIGGWLIHGRPVTIKEWIAAMTLFVGLAAFGLADRLTSPKFTLTGVALTMGNLIGGSMSGNLQQKAIQRADGKTPSQRKDDLMFFQYWLGAAMCLCLCMVNGELSDGIRFSRSASPWQLLNIAGFLLSLFLGLQPLLTLVQQYDATAATVSVALSILHLSLLMIHHFLSFSVFAFSLGCSLSSLRCSSTTLQ